MRRRPTCPDYRGGEADDLVVTEGGYGLPDGFPVVVKP